MAAYFFFAIGAILTSLIPLEALRRLSLTPAWELSAALAKQQTAELQTLPPSQPPQDAEGAAAAAAAATANNGSQLPAELGWLFPEAYPPWFRLHRTGAAVECTGPVGLAATYPGPQAALQVCLGTPWCSCISWDGAMKQAQLASGHRQAVPVSRSTSSAQAKGVNTVVALRNGCQPMLPHQPAGALPQPPCTESHSAALAAATAYKAARGGTVHRPGNSSSLCPAGLHPLSSSIGGMSCSVCPGGFCGVLPEAVLVPPSVLDTLLQEALAVSPLNASGLHRGTNPSLLEWAGRLFVAARAANGMCRLQAEGGAALGGGMAHDPVEQAAGLVAGASEEAAAVAAGGDEETEEGQPPLVVSNHVVMCDLGAAARPLGRAGPLGQPPRAKTCSVLPVDTASLAAQVHGTEAVQGLEGVEDPRAFIHGGRPHLLVTFHVMQPEQNVWVRRRKWFEQLAPLRNHMAVLRLTHRLDSVEHSAVLLCPELNNLRQKNWMPLPHLGSSVLALEKDEMLFVTDIQPLTVVRANLQTGACQLVHGSGGSKADGSSGSDSASEGGAPSLAAVLGGAHIHGGSPFVNVEGDLYISIVHHKGTLSYGPVYTHHFVLLRAQHGSFTVDWVSEGFRLPDLPGVRPNRNVQFASSLLLRRDELVIGYGAGDCHAVLARVPQFRSRLDLWLDRGLGTQSASSARSFPQLLPSMLASNGTALAAIGTAPTAIDTAPVAVVKWEAPLFGREGPWAEAAAAIGSRWQQGALPAARAQLLLRHLDQQASPFRPHSLGSLPLIESNELNSVHADVAISHARLGELLPAVSGAWLPWIPRLATTASSASLELLRQHATQILVPSSFHQEAMVQLLGVPPLQVAVVPQHVPQEDWCPPDFEDLPGRQALQELGGPSASAPGLIFLHQAPASWHYGAAALLEAFSRTFSATDNVTLVLHLQPQSDGDDDEEADSYGGSGVVEKGSASAPASFSSSLQQRVDELARDDSVPRVLLLTRLPRLGRWADKLLQAADVVVLPYLGGTAGHELVRAASCGRPIVTTASGPAADALGRAAWLVPSRLQLCPVAPGTAERIPLGCLQVSGHDLGAALHNAAQQDPAGLRPRGTAAREAAAELAEATGWKALSAALWQHVQEHLPSAKGVS